MKYVTQFLAILAGYIVADRIVKIIENKSFKSQNGRATGLFHEE